MERVVVVAWGLSEARAGAGELGVAGGLTRLWVVSVDVVAVLRRGVAFIGFGTGKSAC